MLYAGAAKVPRIGQDVHVELSHHDLHARSGHAVHARLIFVEVGIVQPVVALKSHSINAQALGFEVPHQPAHSGALARHRHGVVVVIELHFGVGLVSFLKGDVDKFRTNDIIIR